MDNTTEITLISVKVTPGAKRNALTALKEDVWYIKIAAPPVEGKANEELLTFLSQVLGLRQGNLSVKKGRTSRNKLVSVWGLGQKEVTLKLSAELES